MSSFLKDLVLSLLCLWLSTQLALLCGLTLISAVSLGLILGMGLYIGAKIWILRAGAELESGQTG